MKSIEGLTIEELEALKCALSFTYWNMSSGKPEWKEFNGIWSLFMLSIDSQIKDETFEQERKDNLPIEP